MWKADKYLFSKNGLLQVNELLHYTFTFSPLSFSGGITYDTCLGITVKNKTSSD